MGAIEALRPLATGIAVLPTECWVACSVLETRAESAMSSDMQLK